MYFGKVKIFYKGKGIAYRYYIDGKRISERDLTYILECREDMSNYTRENTARGFVESFDVAFPHLPEEERALQIKREKTAVDSALSALLWCCYADNDTEESFSDKCFSYEDVDSILRCKVSCEFTVFLQRCRNDGLMLYPLASRFPISPEEVGHTYALAAYGHGVSFGDYSGDQKIDGYREYDKRVCCNGVQRYPFESLELYINENGKVSCR